MSIRVRRRKVPWAKIQGKVRLIAGEAGRVLRPIENRSIRAQDCVNYPPIFILGAPRSGTTLIYQSITHYYAFSYFNNLSMWFTYAPVLAARISKRFLGGAPASSFSSFYGQTSGLHAPSEFGRFWSRWFFKDSDEQTKQGDNESFSLLRRTIATFSELYGTAAVFKNTYFSLWIEQLHHVFPEAIFVFVRRDPLFTAQSLLKARVEIHEDKEAWMGVKPRGWQALQHLPYSDQIAGQVLLLEQQIEDDLRTHCNSQWYELRYEDFCQAPRLELERLGQFLEGKGVVTARRGTVPESFPISSAIKVSDSDFQQLQDALERLRHDTLSLEHPFS